MQKNLLDKQIIARRRANAISKKAMLKQYVYRASEKTSSILLAIMLITGGSYLLFLFLGPRYLPY